MTRDDEVVQVRAENARLQAENGALRSARAAAQETIRQQQQALAGLEARVAELEQKPPPWAKAQTPPRPPKERKKRAPEHNKAELIMICFTSAGEGLAPPPCPGS